ncbi:MAG: NmrA family NAD(P)-binding protein, partial [Chloroflexota bacterium]
SVRAACAGANMIFASVASMLGYGKNAARHVDAEGHRNLIDIAIENDVDHFVYMSTQEATYDNPVSFFRIKAQIEDYLRNSGLSYTVLRASAFFSPHVEMIGEGVLKGGKALIMGQGDNPRNFIANCDVARFAVIALTDPRARNQTIDIGGPENLTSREVAEIYARVVGVEAKTQVVPRLVPQVMQRVFKPFYTGMSDIMAAILDADTRPKAFDASPVRETYGIELTRLEDWVRNQVEAEA